MIHYEEALYQVYVLLPLHLPFFAKNLTFNEDVLDSEWALTSHIGLLVLRLVRVC